MQERNRFGNSRETLHWPWQKAMFSLFLALMLGFSLSCASEKLVVLKESDQVSFVKPGEVFKNTTDLELVVLSKGSYMALVDVATDTLIGEERHE